MTLTYPQKLALVRRNAPVIVAGRTLSPRYAHTTVTRRDGSAVDVPRRSGTLVEHVAACLHA